MYTINPSCVKVVLLFFREEVSLHELGVLRQVMKTVSRIAEENHITY